MIRVKDIDTVIKSELKEWKNRGKKRMSIAMNMTGKQVKEELRKLMPKIFDRPTKWITNGFYLIPSKPDRLTVVIKIKNETFKGTPAANILAPHIDGGQRDHKPSEKQLIRTGYLDSNEYIVPSKFYKLNKYGNIQSQQMIKILSAVGAFTESGYDANFRKPNRKRGRPFKGTKPLPIQEQEKYFVIKKGIASHLKPGIYRRKGNRNNTQVEPKIIFVNRVTYKKRFDFFNLTVKLYREKINANVERVKKNDW